jgi:hypothetical protein
VHDNQPAGNESVVEMENLALKTKFKTLLQKTGKIGLDFNSRQDGQGGDGGRIPPEWAGLIGVGSPGGNMN